MHKCSKHRRCTYSYSILAFVYVCMYVYMHVCMYVCMYVSMYVCMYVYTTLIKRRQIGELSRRIIIKQFKCRTETFLGLILWAELEHEHEVNAAYQKELRLSTFKNNTNSPSGDTGSCQQVGFLVRLSRTSTVNRPSFCLKNTTCINFEAAWHAPPIHRGLECLDFRSSKRANKTTSCLQTKRGQLC